MIKRIFLCGVGLSFLWACSQPKIIDETKISSDVTTWEDAYISQGNEAAKIGLLLPLSGPSAELGESFKNAAMLAQFDLANDAFEILFFDTEGTESGAKQAYYQAKSAGVDAIVGPIFAAEVASIQEEDPNIPVISFTSDTSVVGDNVYTSALLIPEQVNEIIKFACTAGKQRLAVLGPDNKTSAVILKALEEAVEKCPTLSITQTKLYPPETTNFAPILSKIMPLPVNPNKKDLTPAEIEQLNTPIQELLDFDSVLIIEEGAKLQQLVSLMAYYDVSPQVITFLGLSPWANITDSNFIGSYFVSLPAENYKKFATKYQNTFGTQPIRLSSLAYDSVALVSNLGKQGALTKKYLTSEKGYRGTDGMFRLNKDGSNNRLLEVFQVKGKGRFVPVVPAENSFQSVTDTETVDFGYTGFSGNLRNTSSFDHRADNFISSSSPYLKTTKNSEVVLDIDQEIIEETSSKSVNQFRSADSYIPVTAAENTTMVNPPVAAENTLTLQQKPEYLQKPDFAENTKLEINDTNTVFTGSAEEMKNFQPVPEAEQLELLD